MSVSYEVTHDFADKNTNVRLTANTQGNTLSAEYDRADGLKEVSVQRDVDLGDQTVNVQPSWQVQAKTARVKLMSKLNGGNKLSAQIDYNTNGGDASCSATRNRSARKPLRALHLRPSLVSAPCMRVADEVGYDHSIDDGRDVSATIKPNKKEVEIDYVDNKFESGATWTASASVPLEQSSNIMDAAKLTLKRSWHW